LRHSGNQPSGWIFHLQLNDQGGDFFPDEIGAFQGQSLFQLDGLSDFIGPLYGFSCIFESDGRAGGFGGTPFSE